MRYSGRKQKRVHERRRTKKLLWADMAFFGISTVNGKNMIYLLTELVEYDTLVLDPIGRLSSRNGGGSLKYVHFEALNKEKQERIRNAAYREFGKHGYQKTAAEQVTKAAGIAKGMLFHYFGSKLGLYEYLCTYAADFMRQYFADLQERLEGLDFIEQYQKMTKIKLGAYTKNPCIFEFFTTLYLHPENVQVSETTQQQYGRVIKLRKSAMHFLYSTDNTHCFREDMEPARIKSYIAWLLDGYSQKILADLEGKSLADMDLSPYWQEFDGILADMKTLFYKTD